jgi:hypothetical protein
MYTGKLLIIVIAFSALVGCATHYREARKSEPHAVLRFEHHLISKRRNVYPYSFNGAEAPLKYGNTFRIHPGTMVLGVAEVANAIMGSPTQYYCTLSFEAEAGRIYLVSVAVTRTPDYRYLYAVTTDTGTKVTECAA